MAQLDPPMHFNYNLETCSGRVGGKGVFDAGPTLVQEEFLSSEIDTEKVCKGLLILVYRINFRPRFIEMW